MDGWPAREGLAVGVGDVAEAGEGVAELGGGLLAYAQMRPLPAMVAAVRAGLARLSGGRRCGASRRHRASARWPRGGPGSRPSPAGPGRTAPALEAAYITGDEGGDAWRDRMTELREAFRLALERIAAEGRLAPAWTGETAADWAWARVRPGSWAALVSMRGWDPREYTERTVGSLLAELVTAPGQLPISARFGHRMFTGTPERTADGSGSSFWVNRIIRFFRSHGYRLVRV